MNTRSLLPKMVLLVAAVAGCTTSEQIDPEILNRYQAAMARRSSRHRAETGSKLLSPTEAVPLGELDFKADPKSGKTTISLGLDEAIRRALANNLDIRVVSFDPAISRQEMIQAEAVFDAVVFGSYAYSDQEARMNSAGATPVEVETKEHEVGIGIRKRLPTGADVSVSHTFTRDWSDSAGRRYRSDYEAVSALEISQPLLRDAWVDVNRAAIHITRLNRDISQAAFRQKVEEIITQVISTYWTLARAHREVEIQEDLLDKTIKTHKRVYDRKEYDATAVQIKQAELAIETRRAVLIRAKNNILDVQDRLARLLADRQLNLLDNYGIRLETKPSSARIRYDRADQLLMALGNNPSIQQARLAVQAANIRVRVADNRTLPQLNLTATAALQGRGRSASRAHDQIPGAEYENYGVGLEFEYPLGNRGAEATLRGARFEHLKSIKVLENTADQVAVAVKERIRQVETTYLEILAQTKAVEVGKAQLEAVVATEELRVTLSPEFLQFKLQSQEALAAAQSAQLQAIIDYNVAMVALAQTTGTVLRLHGVETTVLPDIVDLSE